MSNDKIHFQCTEADKNYLPILKQIIGSRARDISLDTTTPTAILEVALRAKSKGALKVATTSQKLLKYLIAETGIDNPSLDDYAGSIITKYDVDFLILNPTEHLVTVPYGKHLYERYFNKFLRPELFLQIPAFSWKLFEPSGTDDWLEYFQSCTFIAVDIETKGDGSDPSEVVDRAITCIGFTGVRIDVATRQWVVRTLVVPATDSYNLAIVSCICTLPVPKIFQNGKYDNAYLLRYGITVINWAFDTQHFFHSWYAEFPKRLDFIVSYLLRKWIFWKDESATGFPSYEYFQYNAKDAFVTAMCFMALLHELPDWAVANYMMEFPLVFPCLMAEMRGIKADKQMFADEESRFNSSLEVQKKKLGVMVANSNFNPSSPAQVMKVFDILGSGDIKDTTPPSRDKVKHRHPLNSRIVSGIETYRKDRKLVTSYLRDYNPKTKRYHTWHSRLFFSLNPHGTDTGRLASKESAFWCGLQIQNIPRDRKDIQVKRCFLADTNFYFGECDYEQAEARDTAYLSGDVKLITAVEGERDFHGVNAAAFFGVRYEAIIADDGSVLDKELRDLSKRVNHGSNYNMGAGVMLDTMGIENVIRARRLLNLPRSYSFKQVTQHLLNVYSSTYVTVKGQWYDKVKADVNSTGFLVGPTGWHRRCFGNPSASKAALNAYVAHPPQSLNAMTLNKAYMRVFYQVALPNPTNFKLGPQIHDSILFQYRKGHEYLAWRVKELMNIPVDVTDSFGIKRTLVVPAALKGHAERWSDVREMPSVRYVL